ncbi:MAG: Transcriptional regulator, TrmB [uncultured bacterium]|nr:MAG: Transcriptional regulator, TrmB [uncultured bacterium]
MDTFPQLEQLGLTKNEAKVYLALLQIGLTSAGAVVKKTRLHRMLVYTALDRLIDRHLVSFVYRNNRKHFQASDPSALLNELSRHTAIARAVIPHLKSVQKRSSENLEVKILYGHHGFTTNLEELVRRAAKDDHVLRIVGGAQADYFYDAIADWYPRYLELLKKYKVVKWQISPNSNSTAFKEKFAREKHTKLRTLKHGLGSPTLTRITKKLVSIEIYTKEIIIIQIYNAAVAEGYRDYFDLLWKQAKTYTPTRS